MHKIYHAKSNNVPLEQLDQDRQWIFDHFKDCEYIQHIKGEQYQPDKIQKAELVIVSTPNHDDHVGRGVTGEILMMLDKIPVIQLKENKDGGLDPVFIKGIQIMNETKWDERHAIIYLGNIAEYLENS